jgi:hypothetical membrane protein
MIDFLNSPSTFQIFAGFGVTIPLVGSLVTALAYRGKEGEPYSPLNHFISELGEVGVSRLAWVFNLSLIFAGLCLLIAGISLGLMLNNLFGKVAVAMGVISALSLAFVGVFPMNLTKPHGVAAMTYFRSGLVMVIMFSLAIAFQREGGSVFNRWLSLAGLLPITAFSAFLVMIQKAYKQTQEPLATQSVPRPKVWNLAVVEWSIFLAMLIWIGMIALGV